MKKLTELLLSCSLALRQIILYVLMAVGVILLLLGYYNDDMLYGLFILGIFVLAIMLLYNFMAFRCPHCNAYLGERMLGYSHCPKCGKPLDE